MTAATAPDDLRTTVQERLTADPTLTWDAVIADIIADERIASSMD